MSQVRLKTWVALALVVAPAFARAEPPKQSNPLLGTWTVVSVHVNGKCQEHRDWRLNEEIVFEEDKVTGLDSADKAAVSKVQLYPDKTPRQFTRFVYSDGVDERLYIVGVGIYSISGATLKWCEVYPDKPVPMDFKTTKGDHRTLIVLKRKTNKPKDTR